MKTRMVERAAFLAAALVAAAGGIANANDDLGPAIEQVGGAPAVGGGPGRWRVSVGGRSSLYHSAGYDAFSSDDAFGQFSATATATVLSGPRFSTAVGALWEDGSSPGAGARRGVQPFAEPARRRARGAVRAAAVGLRVRARRAGVAAWKGLARRHVDRRAARDDVLDDQRRRQRRCRRAREPRARQGGRLDRRRRRLWLGARAAHGPVARAAVGRSGQGGRHDARGSRAERRLLRFALALSY